MHVVVTGASRGIGRATALRLAANGFEVFATVRSDADEAGLGEASGGSIRSLRLDLTDDQSIRAAVDGLTGSGVDALYGLVNVAAASGRLAVASKRAQLPLTTEIKPVRASYD